jgi:hypothetical protein
MIHVDLPTQMVAAFEGNTMVFSVRCSSGGKGTYTPTGEFSTYHRSICPTNQDEEGDKLPSSAWDDIIHK